MKGFRNGILAAALGTFALSPIALAQSSADRMVSADSGFAMKAAQGGLAEVQMGQLALQKAQSADVKSFGQKMVDDHSKANEELMQIASKKNISLPASMNAKDQATYDRLSKLSGEAFDKAYMADMVRDHHADIAEFQKEASGGSDNDLKMFAGKMLPTLEGHLQLAQTVTSKTTK